MWVVAPGTPLFCEIIWEGVLPEGIDLVSVAYNFPAGITGVSAAVDTEDGKSAVAMEGMTHGSMHQIRMLATLSDGSTIGCTAPLRCFNG